MVLFNKICIHVEPASCHDSCLCVSATCCFAQFTTQNLFSFCFLFPIQYCFSLCMLFHRPCALCPLSYNLSVRSSASSFLSSLFFRSLSSSPHVPRQPPQSHNCFFRGTHTLPTPGPSQSRFPPFRAFPPSTSVELSP